GTTKATAHVYSPPLSPPRIERESVRHPRAGRPASATDAVSIMALFALSRRLVLGEDLFNPLERLLDRRLGLDAILGDVDHRHAPDVLRADLGHRQVVHVVVRHGRAEETLLHVPLQMRVL